MLSAHRRRTLVRRNHGSLLIFRLAFNFFSKLIRHKSLIRNMVLRDLRSRYVGSAMGFFWSVIHPLVLLASYTFVFSVVLETAAWGIDWHNQFCDPSVLRDSPLAGVSRNA